MIIKYWYGQENDDFQHWNSILGLKEPEIRNWTGVEKTYFTYREFLIFLDQNRRNHAMEKCRSKKIPHEKKLRKASAHSETPMHHEDPIKPSMEDFLFKKKVSSSSRKKLTKTTC